MFTTDTWLRIVCSMMINAVLFGAGAILVLSVPALAEQAKFLLPVVVVTSFVAAPFFAFAVAPRMRLRNWGTRDWQKGDAISG
jgi:ABC-type sulfate transport system permease subunit